MSRREDHVRLRHMLENAREAVSLIHGKTRADLDSNRVLALALVRLLEVVGEAAARVTAETQQANPAIPWAQVVSLRNRLIHGYEAVDHDILWNILSADLPPLIAQVEKILSTPPAK